MASEFKIGSTSGGVTSLDALTPALPDPQPVYNQYREMVRLANNRMRGMGLPLIVWTFPLLEPEQIAELESHYSTSPIYIRSRKRDDTFEIFEVEMNIPDPRQDGDHLFQGVRSGYTVEFTVLSEVP